MSRDDNYRRRWREITIKEPLNNSLRTQRGLKRAAVVPCLDGKGGSLFKRQGTADGRFRPRPPGLPGWSTLVVACIWRYESRQATSMPSKVRSYLPWPRGWISLKDCACKELFRGFL